MARRTREWPVQEALANLVAHTDYAFYLAQRDEQVRRIEGRLRESALGQLALLSSDLDALAHLEGVYGVARVGMGEPDGWAHLRLFLVTAYWSVRARRAVRDCGFQVDGLDYQEFNLACRCLAHAVAIGDDALADWFLATIQPSVSGQDDLYQQTDGCFEQFIVAMYGYWKGGPSPADPGRDRFGPYTALFRCWRGESSPDLVYTDLCRYHCQLAVRLSGPRAAFAREPHNYYPVELLALVRMSRDLNLPIPQRVDHPLFQTALVAFHSPVGELPCEVLNRVSQRVEELERAAPTSTTNA
jgi:hypothetical protein